MLLKCKRNLKLIVAVILSFLIVFLCYKVNEDSIVDTSVLGRFNMQIKELNRGKYKDYKGAELYEGGILNDAKAYYTVYEIDSDVLNSYNGDSSLKTILKSIKPIVESPLYSKSNEILSVLQIRGNNVVEKDLSVSVSDLNFMLNGNLDKKLTKLTNDIGNIDDIKYIRIKDYNVDGLLLVSKDKEYIMPLLTERALSKVDLVNFNCYSVDIFMEKIMLLEK